MSAASSFRDDAGAVETIFEELLLDAEEARDDQGAFCEFVARAEDTQEPIRLAPHQRVVLDFVRAHRKCVVMLPIDHAKTFLAAVSILWMLGDNCRLRGGIVSAAEAQAKKALGFVKDYIERSQELALVFPRLRRSSRSSDAWTDTAIVVDRPMGIRDPSLAAFGILSERITGSRWDFAVIDDVLNDDNVASPELRDKVHKRVQKDVISRVDRRNGRVLFINTARHPEDTVQRHAEHWPTLTMRVDGTILVRNSPSWDCGEIRPADDKPADDPTAEYRLVAHDPDAEHAVPLWPERWPVAVIEECRRDWLPEVFAQNLMNIPLSDAASLCKQAYLDRGLAVAKALGVTGFAARREDVVVRDLRGGGGFAEGTSGGLLVFTGVDLAVSKSSSADKSAIFTFAVFPGAVRVPLWIDEGKWGAKEIEERLFGHILRYSPAGVAVESNAAQELVRQMLVDRQEQLVAAERRAPIKPFTTTAKKHNPFFGVPAIFTEMANGLWAIPNDRGMVRPEVRSWMNQCLQYSPSDHSGDALMATYFASELAKKYGALARARDPKAPRGAGIAATLMAR